MENPVQNSPSTVARVSKNEVQRYICLGQAISKRVSGCRPIGSVWLTSLNQNFQCMYVHAQASLVQTVWIVLIIEWCRKDASEYNGTYDIKLVWCHESIKCYAKASVSWTDQLTSSQQVSQSCHNHRICTSCFWWMCSPAHAVCPPVRSNVLHRDLADTWWGWSGIPIATALAIFSHARLGILLNAGVQSDKAETCSRQIRHGY